MRESPLLRLAHLGLHIQTQSPGGDWSVIDTSLAFCGVLNG